MVVCVRVVGLRASPSWRSPRCLWWGWLGCARGRPTYCKHHPSLPCRTPLPLPLAEPLFTTDEGGGLFRDVRVIRTAAPARLADDGVFVPTSLAAGSVAANGPAPTDGLTGAATISPQVTVDVVSPSGSASVAFTARVSLYAADGATRVGGSDAAGAAPGGSTITLTPPAFELPRAQLWSVARPYLYTVVAELLDASGAVVDTTNVTLGVRGIAFDAREGAFLNGQHLKLRGFCNHASFAAVGMGVPPRINLLRLQQIRGMGGNSWCVCPPRDRHRVPTRHVAWHSPTHRPPSRRRMSHNPGSPMTFALGDALGMTFLDEVGGTCAGAAAPVTQEARRRSHKPPVPPRTASSK